MKKNYPRLASMLYGAPLMVLPEKAAIIERVFQQHILGDSAAIRLMDDDGPSETPEQKAERIHAERCKTYAGIALQKRDDKPYAITTSGIALIPVMGTLIQRGSWMDSMSGLTGYDELTGMLNTAEADVDVRAIVQHIDSPGGQVNGAFEHARRVAQVNQRKPVWSHADEQAYSAAYLIACSGAKFFLPLTGGTGSIGTMAMHIDQTKRDSMMGYAYTVVYAGEEKADLNSHLKLSDRARAKLQAEVNRINDLFLSHVAEQRSLSVEAVAATRAACLAPLDAIAAGLADGVHTLAETIALLESELGIQGGGSVFAGTRLAAETATPVVLIPIIEKENDMSDPTKPAASNAAPQTTAPAATAADADKARSEGAADGSKAERARIAGILACDEAKSRPKFANHLAMETDTDVESAKKLLAAAAVEQAANPLAAAMAGLNNPKVGADADTTTLDQPKPIASAASVYAARREQVRAH